MKSKNRRKKMIRVGVIGLGRGRSFAAGAQYAGMELVALCDSWKEKLLKAGTQYPKVALYTDYDRFLEHDMDAVVLANYFHQHAPFAVKALQAGLHVMSETSACKTLAEGVALARAVERSQKIYMLAENYCYFACNQEMRRLYRQGEIGEVQLAECEYIHPMDRTSVDQLAPGVNHWRNWLPSTYYCTHALAPIMYITDTRPLYVNAHSLAYSGKDRERPSAKLGDIGSSILCKMDNGATTIVNGLLLRGHGNWYRLHGTRGLMENLRTQNDHLRIVHESWDRRPGEVREKIYTPDFPVHADLARKAGHGGGDFYTNFFFAEAIRSGRPPYLDVYRGLAMTLVGIQGWRSCLARGAPMEIPDLRKESVRKRYEADNWSPFPEDAGKGQPPPSIRGLVLPGRKALAQGRRVWRAQGYMGK